MTDSYLLHEKYEIYIKPNMYKPILETNCTCFAFFCWRPIRLWVDWLKIESVVVSDGNFLQRHTDESKHLWKCIPETTVVYHDIPQVRTSADRPGYKRTRLYIPKSYNYKYDLQISQTKVISSLWIIEQKSEFQAGMFTLLREFQFRSSFSYLLLIQQH